MSVPGAPLVVVTVSLTVTALLVLGACFDPRPPAGGACAPGDRCPAPLLCRSGVCLEEGGPEEQGDGGVVDGPARGDGGVALVCPASYVEVLPGVCHRRFGTMLPWAEAEARCEQDGAHLVVPSSLAEAKLAANPMTGLGWLGVTDRRTEGTFRTVTGSPLPYSGWRGQPPRTEPLDCVFGDINGLFEEGPCEFSFPFSCEYDGAAADPTAF